MPFLREGIAGGEAMLVAVSRERIALLQEALGADAGRVSFADMALIGQNPARIIPIWQDFVTANGGRPVRGIGEPIWPGRTPEELVECVHHESLLNLAFAEAQGFALLCPYATLALEPDAIDAARCTHPHVVADGVARASVEYEDPGLAGRPFGGWLAPPPADAEELWFDRSDLGGVRQLVADGARRAGLGDARTADVTLAASELAANSVRHAGGGGVLRVWSEGDRVVCEVEDAGRIDQPLVGRVRPTTEQPGGRGLWMVNQLCDLVQIRVRPTGCVVRAHMGARAYPARATFSTARTIPS